MKATIEEIQNYNYGVTLKVNICEPLLPQYDSYFTGEEKKQYEEAYTVYEQRLKEYKLLRLGAISFDYEDKD